MPEQENSQEAHDPEPSGVFAFGNDHALPSLRSRRELASLFGEEYKDCETIACPAQRAGYSPAKRDGTEVVAHVYDQIVRHRVSDGDCSQVDGDNIVLEDDAKRAWLDATAHVKWAVDSGTVDSRRTYAAAAVSKGRIVARELGWLADDEDVEAEKITGASLPTMR